MPVVNMEKKARKKSEPLDKTHPNLAREAHGWDPAKVTQWSPEKVSWKCENCEFTWMERIKNRSYRNTTCPKCSKRARTGRNSLPRLLISHPELAEEAFGWDPQTVTARSPKKQAWKCRKCGHMWKCSVRGRALGYGNCNKCRPAVNQKSLVSQKAWKCPTCDYSWETKLGGIVGDGCRKCSLVFKRYDHPLSTTHPSVAAEACGWNPEEFTAGSGNSMLWKCGSCGNDWKAPIKRRAGDGTGCRKCNRAFRKFEGPLSKTHPHLAQEAAGWNPSGVSSGSEKRMEWLCGDCGNIWQSSVKDRVHSYSRCPTCNKRKFSDPLAETHPNLAAEALGWDPCQYTAGSRVSLKWQCAKCDHIWQAPPAHRTRGFKRCKNCGPVSYGYDKGKPGYLYLLERKRDGVSILQYGITGNPPQRCSRHRLNGFEEVPGNVFFYFPRGEDALDCETLISKRLTERGIPSICTDSETEDEFDGYTEAFRGELLEVRSLPDLVKVLDIDPPFLYYYVNASSVLDIRR